MATVLKRAGGATKTHYECLACTLIEVSRFVSSDYLMEIEAVAVKPE